MKKTTQLQLHRKALKQTRANYESLRADYKKLEAVNRNLRERLWSLKSLAAQMANC